MSLPKLRNTRAYDDRASLCYEGQVYVVRDCLGTVVLRTRDPKAAKAIQRRFNQYYRTIELVQERKAWEDGSQS